MRVIQKASRYYDAAIIGSGFGSTFFLHQFLKHASPTARIVVLERGVRHEHAEQLSMGQVSAVDPDTTWIKSGDTSKSWNFTIAFGGGSNCWWANSLRQHPSDFKLRSNYGVGRDWPLSYEDLTTYYREVENIMEISGPDEFAPGLRNGPYPLPPHRLPIPDRMLKRAYPNHHFVMSTARPSRNASSRPKCCVNGICGLCPIDSKFTIQNSFMSPYEDPRVEVLLEAEARSVIVESSIAKGVTFMHGKRDSSIRCDLVVLGANAIFNPVILKNSGLDHPELGRNINEQYGLNGEALLEGLDHFQGSTVVNGVNYARYDGAFRTREASALMETWNLGRLRAEPGKWKQVLPFLLKLEDLPQQSNRIEFGNNVGDPPTVVFEGYSDYTLRTAARAKEIVAEILSPLPIEKININSKPKTTSSHIHGTTIMGADPSDSILDSYQIHHQVRNLVAVGGGGFPSGSQTNPTLTICAMAMRAADAVGASA